ncbi:leucine-rich repeats and immunoglobulin-like domains protein 2 [Montipora capricornis]|uniref:leucine-rich repeats and immunoglobulin-like domains protein 2 n=1 Tax=Montipora capricornis TaxID=246305 RepID=UPI0035F1A22A
MAPVQLDKRSRVQRPLHVTPDGNSITWYEPLPIQTIQDASRLDHSSYTKLLKRANNASLSWNFSLSSDLIFDSLTFSFEGVAIAGVRSSGRGVLPRFQDKYKISWISFQRFTLVILNVTIKDNGTFSCEVYAAKGVATFRWKSNVQAYVVDVFKDPPSNIVASNNQIVTAPAELTLECSADGSPKPAITWTRLSDNTQVTMPLNISSKLYGGHYRCTADNGLGTLTKDVFVNVLWLKKEIDSLSSSLQCILKLFAFILAVRPKVTLPSKFYIAREQTASLQCTVEGNPTPAISWTPCDFPSIGCDKQQLNISKVQTSRANYTCTATNYLGSDSQTAGLFIGGCKIYLSISTSEECENKDSVWETLQNELAKTFANTQSYIGAEVIAVRCGSLIYDLVLMFYSEVEEDDVISTIRNAIVDGKLGELNVNRSSSAKIPCDL